jgi:hypothetical protein
MKQQMFRQGDVLVVAVDEIPDDVRPVPKDNGRVVLAYGEATGHAHVVEGSCALLEPPPADEDLVTPGDLEELNLRFLRVEEECVLVHDEHDTITLPPGDYRVGQQREYSPEELRTVAD